MRKNIEYVTLKELDWTEVNTLSPEQYRQLIREKTERALFYLNAMKKAPVKG
jgi:hypothetical protein